MVRGAHPAVYLLLLALGLTACSAGTASAEPSPAPGEGSGTPSADSGGSPGELDDELRVSPAGWSTDFSKHDVDLSEIISGGPGKDGIPAVDAPVFEPLSNGGWLEDQEPVISVGVNDQWRAYPISILVWHEIVNDTLAGRPITVTFCPLCHTAIVFDREVDGRVLDFGTTGNLRHSDLVMYDRQTESWWQQATGQAIVGELTGTQLEFLPSQLVSWEQFRTLHPDGELLARDTGHVRSYGRNPYPGYDRTDSDPFLLADETLLDGRLNPKVRVVAIAVGGEAVAYPLPDLAKVGVANDDVGGTPIVVLWAPGTASGLGAETVAGGDLVGAATIFERRVGGRELTFEPAGDGQMRDRETGSTWRFDGLAVDGELAGQRLRLLAADSPFWFAWVIFRPDTRIWQPAG